jgi:hypothetical protein
MGEVASLGKLARAVPVEPQPLRPSCCPHSHTHHDQQACTTRTAAPTPAAKN